MLEDGFLVQSVKALTVSIWPLVVVALEDSVPLGLLEDGIRRMDFAYSYRETCILK